jgi:hypothetical protein
MPSTMRKMIAAAFLASALALIMAPARSAETATPDDTAHFLAGLPPAADSPLAALSKSPLWEEHAHHFDSIFGQEEKNTLSKVRAFSRDRLTEKHETMLYMFSGPDFLYAVSFFPSASTYVLSGLEPVGDIPQLTGLPRASIDQTLRNLEVSLSSILNLSFFITKNMQTQLSTGPVYGTLPVLYVFLARTGKTIHDVSFVSLDADGNFQAPSDPGAKGNGKLSARGAESAAKGVKIVFSDGSGPNQTLYYFSTNVADDGVKRSGFLAFCAKLGVADSFVKSASYLMHSGSFTTVRNFLLDHSATILQDDTGIPLAYFDPKKWQLQPFGNYLGPIAAFAGSYQPGMAQLFRNGNSIPIDFGLGYRWRRNESNLLLAQRIGPVDGTGVNSALTTGSDGLGATRGSSKSRRKRSQTDGKAPPWAHWFQGFPVLFGSATPK